MSAQQQSRIVNCAWSSEAVLSSKPQLRLACERAAIEVLRRFDVNREKCYVGIACVYSFTFIPYLLASQRGAPHHHNDQNGYKDENGKLIEWITVYYLNHEFHDVDTAHIWIHNSQVSDNILCIVNLIKHIF